MPRYLQTDLFRNIRAVIYRRGRYNAVNFPPNPPKIHRIAPPLGRDMESILWVQTVIYTLSQSTQGCMQYHVILDRVITALDCLCLS